MIVMYKEIKARANYKKRTFTLWLDGKKEYRTYPMSKEEFQSALYHTYWDWQHFLKTDNYYKI